MGKGAAAEMKKRKKKGRPSLLDLQKRNLIQQQQEEEEQQKKRKHQNPITTSNPNRRSTRRNPATDVTSVDGGNDDGDYDDDDERKEKKVKLVVRLPPSNHHHSPQPKASENSLSSSSASQGSDSNADAENHEVSLEKQKINDIGHRSGADQLEKVQKATGTQHGSTLDSGPTTPLPDKKLLVFILDRLQKKDTHGVFSEPVDPNELPDYHEIIEHPMDFQTVRKKLDEGHYSNLDEFEADVFLICSNAMQYNAPDTVYFRQARSIQELAKRDFENLRQVNDDGEPQPKIVRRGRPPSKNLKSAFGSPPIERVGPESSSDATLATGGDNVVGSNSYNLRRAPISSRFQSNEALFRTSNQSRNSETYVDWSFDWNSEFPASVLKAEAKYGKKQFSFDENRRATYRQFHPSAFGHASSILTTLNGGMKQLMGVGLHSEHGYARSLSRFAANLGPAVWKIASKKMKCVLPAGVEFGPGWVGVNEASPRPASSSPDQKSSNNSVYDGHPLGPITMSVSGTNSVVTCRSSLPCTEPMVEVVPGQTSNSDLAVFRSGASGISPGPSFQTLQKRVLNADRNGFNGVSWYDHSSPMGSMPPQMVGVVTWSNTTTTPPMTVNRINPELKLPGSSCSAQLENTSAPSSAPDSQTAPEVALTGVQPWQGLPSHCTHYSLPVPPDLNVRFQAPGSPNSNFRIGSPQQPDLALQL